MNIAILAADAATHIVTLGLVAYAIVRKPKRITVALETPDGGIYAICVKCGSLVARYEVGHTGVVCKNCLRSKRWLTR